ncbi:MAG: hypothetical protein WC976_06820 [Caldisericia bacterium]
MTKKIAKAKIIKLLKEGRVLFYSDITSKTKIDLKTVVEICNELKSEGFISYDNFDDGKLRKKK